MSGKSKWQQWVEFIFNSPFAEGKPWVAEKINPMTWAKNMLLKKEQEQAGPSLDFGTNNYNGLNLHDRADLGDPESICMAKQELEELEDLDLEPVQEEEAKPDLVDLNSFTMGVKIDVNENWKDKVGVESYTLRGGTAQHDQLKIDRAKAQAKREARKRDQRIQKDKELRDIRKLNQPEVKAKINEVAKRKNTTAEAIRQRALAAQAKLQRKPIKAKEINTSKLENQWRGAKRQDRDIQKQTRLEASAKFNQ